MGAGETDETRATGGTARATKTQNDLSLEAFVADDIGGVLDAIAGESQRILAAVEQTLFAELSAEIEQAKRKGLPSEMVALVAQIRRKRQSKMAAARLQEATSVEGQRRSAKRQAKRKRIGGVRRNPSPI